eukprot:scaffold4390_cov264-Pinguiococcus_pyrenoidosus.AAC.15
MDKIRPRPVWRRGQWISLLLMVVMPEVVVVVVARRATDYREGDDVVKLPRSVVSRMELRQ